MKNLYKKFGDVGSYLNSAYSNTKDFVKDFYSDQKKMGVAKAGLASLLTLAAGCQFNVGPSVKTSSNDNYDAAQVDYQGLDGKDYSMGVPEKKKKEKKGASKWVIPLLMVLGAGSAVYNANQGGSDGSDYSDPTGPDGPHNH